MLVIPTLHDYIGYILQCIVTQFNNHLLIATLHIKHCSSIVPYSLTIRYAENNPMRWKPFPLNPTELSYSLSLNDQFNNLSNKYTSFEYIDASLKFELLNYKYYCLIIKNLYLIGFDVDKLICNTNVGFGIEDISYDKLYFNSMFNINAKKNQQEKQTSQDFMDNRLNNMLEDISK